MYKNIVTKLISPTSNFKHEMFSSDGFAFWGYALQKHGIRNEYQYEKIKNFNFSIYDEVIIKKHVVPKNKKFTYTYWPCVEYLKEIDDKKNICQIVTWLDEIGEYSNGMMRYCDYEIDYMVPNATSCASMIYAMAGEVDKAKKYLEKLCETQQKNGSWLYYDVVDKNMNVSKVNETDRYEDCMHQAMIIYHMVECSKILSIPLEDNIINKAVDYFDKNPDRKGKCCGTLLWGIPMAFAMYSSLSDSRKERYKKYIKKIDRFKNFRAKAYCLWSLSKHG